MPLPLVSHLKSRIGAALGLAVIPVIVLSAQVPPRAQAPQGAPRTPAVAAVSDQERVADSLFRAGALEPALAAYRALRGVPAARVALVRLRTASLLGWTAQQLAYALHEGKLLQVNSDGNEVNHD